ncbi:MAG: hypothetical protein KatS3mg047_1197 [Bellilinea sp.]|nr:MAG: hypothetical protein KatS3mg047_1197 [Bellilinea sp.]
MRKLIFALAVLLGILFIISRFTEVQEVLLVLQNGNWLWLGAAFILLLGWILVTAATFQSLFSIVGVVKPLAQVLRLFLAVNFINLVAPSAGMSGMVVFYSDAQKNGHSTARIMVGSALFLIFDYCGLLTIIFLGLIILAFYQVLWAFEIFAFLLFVVFVSVMISVVYLASQSEDHLTRLSLKMTRFVNRYASLLLKKTIISEERVIRFAAETCEGVKAIQNLRHAWLRPAGFTLLNKMLLVSILGLMFLAFGTPVTPGQLIAGFSIAYLFVIISPTPAGIGIVEGLLTFALNSLSIPIEAAAVITLAFRGYTFWLPFFLGMISFRSLHS